MEDDLVSDDNSIIIGGDENVKIFLDNLETKLKKKRLKDGILNIIGTSLQKLQQSVVQGMNFIFVYLVYFLHSENDDDNITKENTLTLAAIFGFTEFSTIWIGGVLKHYLGLRIIMTISSLFLILASLGILFFRSLFAYQIMIFFLGAGVGVPQSITNVNTIQYIPEKKGFITGVFNIAWTLGTTFFNFLSLHVINPSDKDVQFLEDEKAIRKQEDPKYEYYDDDKLEHKKVLTFMYVAVGCFIVLSILSIVLTFPFHKERYEPNEQNVDKDGNIINSDDSNSTTSESKKKKKEEEDDFKFTELLKCPRFYTCFFYCSFRNVHAYLIGSSFQIFALHYETVSVRAQKIITTLSYLANFVTTFGLSFFIDKFKYRNVNVPNFLCVMIHALTFQFIKKNSVIYVIYFFLVGVFSSIDNLATFPHLYRVFGTKHVALIFGIFNIGTGLFNFGLSYLVDVILSGKPPGPDYDHSLSLLMYISAMFTLTSVTLMLLESEDPVHSKIKIEEKS